MLKVRVLWHVFLSLQVKHFDLRELTTSFDDNPPLENIMKSKKNTIRLDFAHLDVMGLMILRVPEFCTS